MITAATIGSFAPAMMDKLLLNMEWQGPIGLDFTAKGSKDAYNLEVKIDATASNIKLGKVFLKGPGLPFKISATTLVQSEGVSIRDGTVSFGEDKAVFKGFLKRDDNLSFRLKMEAERIADTPFRRFFPRLVIVDSFEELIFSVDMNGFLLAGDSTVEMNGEFRAKRAQVSGVSIDDFEGVFLRRSDSVEFPTVKGGYAGGELSGNGSVSGTDEREYKFDGVVERLDAEKIQSLGGAFSGKGSLVLHVSTKGIEPLTLSKNLTVSGSLIIPSGSWQVLKVSKGIFSKDTWKGLEALSGPPLDGVWKVKLGAAGDEFTDFNASYELIGTELSLTSGSWMNPQYVAEGMKGAILISSAGMDRSSGSGFRDGLGNFTLNVEGVAIVPKGIAVQLIPDVTAQKRLLDPEGRLVLPIKIDGTLKSPKYQMDHVKFANSIEDKPLEGEPEGEPAKIIRQDKPVSQKTVEKGKKAPQTKPAKKAAPRGQTRKSTSSSKKKDTEDILKVIIGH
ncbi:MAG: hypothetical protein HN337_07165 [Deltaproteobacteria bacterium]|nr:hypothetical protein [Deltaproteobacteria bacterium]